MDNGASSYRRYLDGDETGFREIIEMYSKSLLFFINGLIGNLSASEDLMEDTFCDLIVYKNRFKGKSSFKTYLFSIARNKAVDFIKGSRKSAYLDETVINSDCDELSELENSIIKNDLQKQIKNALNLIKTEYKALLILLYFEQLSYDDAGQILKKSSKQIKNLAYSARKSLKAALEKEGFVYEEL